MVMVVDMKVFTLSARLKTLSSCELMVDDIVDGKNNKEKKIRGSLTLGYITSVGIFFDKDVLGCGDKC